MSLPPDHIHNQIQEYSLTLQKQLLQNQIQLSKLHYQSELDALQKTLLALQNEELSLQTLLQERNQREETDVSETDLTQSCHSVPEVESNHLTESTHSVFQGSGGYQKENQK